MTKQDEFLWCFQTMVMLDSHNVCLDLDVKDRHKISVAGRIETIVYGIRASRHIPDNYSAEHAAHELFHWIKSLGQTGGSRPPTWFPHADLDLHFI